MRFSPALGREGRMRGENAVEQIDELLSLRCVQPR